MATTNSMTLGIIHVSFADQYYSHQWSFETMMRAIAELGPDIGVEMVAPMFNPDHPHVTPAFAVEWKQTCERNRLKPTSYAIYSDHRGFYPAKDMTDDEAVDYMICHIKSTAMLGFPVMRAQWFSYPYAERLLPALQKYKVHMGYEMHALVMVGTETGQILLNQCKKVSSEWLGVIPDFSIFEEGGAGGMSRPAGVGPDGQQLKPGEFVSEGVVVRADKPEALRQALPYTKHIHGKYHHFVNGQFVGVPYEELVRILVEEGYSGSISLEWEGRDYGAYGNAINILKATVPVVRSMIAKYSKAKRG